MTSELFFDRTTSAEPLLESDCVGLWDDRLGTFGMLIHVSVCPFMVVGLNHATLDSNIIHLIFNFFGCGRIGASYCNDRRKAREAQKDTEGRASIGRSPLCRRSDPEAPGYPSRPDAVGEVERAGQNTDDIKDRPDNRKASHGLSKGTGGVVRTELSHTNRLGHRLEPPVRVEPTMKMEYVGEDKHKGNVARDTLPRVPAVARVSVSANIGVPRTSNPNASDCVENDRQKNEDPLHHRQKWDAMDRKNGILEDFRTTREAGVGQQVDAHVRPYRNQATQRVEPTNQEFVALKKASGRFRARCFSHSQRFLDRTIVRFSTRVFHTGCPRAGWPSAAQWGEKLKIPSTQVL